MNTNNWRKNSDKKPWLNRDQKKSKKKAERNYDQEFEQSMCEDMRGAVRDFD